MSNTIQTEFGKALLMTNGYYFINSHKGKYAKKYVHRLVWEKHNGPIPKGMIIHHKDGNKKNNDISNLEIMSRVDHINLHADESAISEFRIIKAGFMRGKQRYLLKFKSNVLYQSVDYEKVVSVKSYYEKYNLTDVPYKHIPRIIKDGFKGEKQVYALRYNSKRIMGSVDFLKVESALEKLLEELYS